MRPRTPGTLPMDLIIPSDIPWDNLRGKDLEECAYWLLDALGAKDLEWRVGGQGPGGTDQGRDLECLFYVTHPDGEIAPQRWWLEVKGRAGTLEPAAVKESVLNAAGVAAVDVLVIATNTQFSNPTRDWVKNWQTRNARPKVRLWDRSVLERHVSQHPSVIARLFRHALSPQGHLEVARSAFWNHSRYAGPITLRMLWSARGRLKWNPQSFIAVIASELANGDVTRRPWPLLFDQGRVLEALKSALINAPYFCVRATELGNDQAGYLGACGYLILAAISETSATQVSDIIGGCWEGLGSQEQQRVIRDVVVEAVLTNLVGELQDVCTSDCSRVISDRRFLSESEVDSYWKRLDLPESEEEEPEESHLVIEYHDSPCAIGLDLDRERTCPIMALNDPITDVSSALEAIKRIVQARHPRVHRDGA
jgi:hypothetical protein